MGIVELRGLLEIVDGYDDLEYLFSVIIRNAGPTIKKHKTSSLINFSNSNRNSNNIWERYKDEVKAKLDIDYFELKKDITNTFVLFYNKEKIKLSISDNKNMEFLKRFGYNEKMNIKECLLLLGKRFENMCPHEIGIFLGYPLEDVVSFVDYPNAKCKMVGYWKVYHDIEKAEIIFNKYDEIKFTIMRLMMKGMKPTELLNKVNQLKQIEEQKRGESIFQYMESKDMYRVQ
ncbi:DUF3793 family protein [Clostridium sp. CF011]|uniref:DUF3793 family protein n=1 Tax=Clostridium sp. CF011 TaxID=2843318 RepID=UPI001C0B6FD4|nr:DUF3793 family protein [Clostridium sp. CF011]MBU3092016.1 DUF3793 family protein [Clostridium sp. CF011]WAG71301.1 DUF3793 family protein [Clostridium sp. CF011]